MSLQKNQIHYQMKIVVKMFQQTKVKIILLVLATVISYSDIFANGFAGDDRDFIVNWELNRSFANISAMFQGAVPRGHEGVYRPLRGIAYIAAYSIFGTEVMGYHLLSIVIHVGATLLVYSLIKELTGSESIAWVAGLIFGVHPIHVEAITNITTAFDVMGIIFFLMAVWLYIKRYAKKKAFQKNIYLLSIFCGGVAIFWYEMALVLPILLILIDGLVYKQRLHKDSLSNYLPYFLLVGMYSYVRFGVLAISARASYQANSFYLTQLASVKALLKYLTLLVVPLGSNINHMLPGGVAAHTLIEINAPAIRAQSLSDVPIIVALLIIGSLLWLAYVIRKYIPILSLGIGWIFVSLLPVLNIFPSASLMHEKYTYLASVGYVLILAWSIDLFYRLKKNRRKWLIAGVGALLCWYGYLTFERNRDWKNDVLLWEKTAQQSPENPIVHYKLGSAYRDVGDLKKAKEEYSTSLEMYPQLVEALNNLGVIAELEGEYEKAEKYYLRALEIRPYMPELYNNLGVIYVRQEQYEAAIEKFTIALQYDQNYLQARINLAEAQKSLRSLQIEGK